MSPGKKAVEAQRARLVIDSSVAIAWCFPDERDTYSQAVLDALATQPAIVPGLWHLEVANTLLVGERRRRSTSADTVKWIGYLSALPVSIDGETKANAFGTTLSLAREHGLSVYDAAYLELAMRRGLVLTTLDQKLKGAAEVAGVSLF